MLPQREVFPILINELFVSDGIMRKDFASFL